MNNGVLSQLKQRNAYVRLIQRTFIEQILIDHFQERQNLLEELIRENTHQLNVRNPGTITPTFMYNGEFYRALNWFASREDNREIHSSMMTRIADFMLHKDFNFSVQKSHVENYVANTLTFAKHKNDLFELIPSKFHHILHAINEDLFNIGPAADEAAITQFKKTNHRGLVEFQRLFLEHLLLH